MKRIPTTKKILKQGFWIIALTGILFAVLAFSFIPATKTIQIRIADSSKLHLEGSSNVNSFNCHCLEHFPEYNIDFLSAPDSRKIIFPKAQINIPVIKLDCGNTRMNKDLQEALRALEHPIISINIQEASQLDNCFIDESCDQWTNISVDANITIADVSLPAKLNVQAMKINEDRFRFLAIHPLSMCDYNIDPPQALMGLIKVNPMISIHFDLTVEVLSGWRSE